MVFRRSAYEQDDYRDPRRPDVALAAAVGGRCPEPGTHGSDPEAGGSPDYDDGGQVRPGGLQQRGLCHPRIPGQQSVDRRRVDAARSRHDGARQDAGLHAQARGAVARHTRRQDAAAAVGQRTSRGQHQRDSGSDAGPARPRSTTSRRWRRGPCRIGFFSDLDQRVMPYDRSNSATRAPASAASTSTSPGASCTASTGST